MTSGAWHPLGLTTLIAAFLANPAIFGADVEDEGRLWAVLICVERYSDASIPVPPNAARHASEIAALLSDRERFDLAADRLVVVTPSAAGNATAKHWRDTLEQIAGQAKPNDTLLIVLIATGAPASDSEFRWLAADADESAWPETSLLSGEMKELVDAIPCQRVFTIVDACFNLSPERLHDAQGILEESWSMAFRPFEGNNRVVLASTDGQADSIDDWQTASDAFLGRTLDGLKGNADRDGGEADGWITAREIVQYVCETTPTAWSMGLGSDIWLARNPVAVAQTQQRLALLKTKFDQGLLDESLYQTGARLLERMPRWDDDRKLRSQFVEYIEDRLPIEKLQAARHQLLSQRQLPEKEAQAFADKVQEAWLLIEEHHLDPGQAGPALAIGLTALANEFGKGDDASIQSDIRRIRELKPPELKVELARLRWRLGRRETIADDRATDVCLSAMLASLDPYSAYLSTDTFRELSEQASGKYTGIGALLREDPSSSSIVVLAPIRGGPADSAGLRPNDRILAVDGKKVEEVGVETASQALIGPEGSTVQLGVARDDGSLLEISVQRRTVELESILGVRHNPDGTWDYWLDRDRGIAYIQLTTFAHDTADRLRRLLLDLEQEGMLSLILDLRFNRGGLLESAVEVSDLFLADGPIVRIKGRKEDQKTFEARRFGTFDDVRLCVLVNSGSASGSEILAASIQDNRRGTIAGSRSFGKASVQDVIPMSDKRSAIKVTSARFFRPDGKNIERFLGGRLKEEQDWGIVPDAGLAAPMYREQMKELQERMVRRQVLDTAIDYNADPQLVRALEYVRSASR